MTSSNISGKRKTKAAIAGLSLLAVCGLAVGGTQAAFNDGASQIMAGSSKGISLTVNDVKTYEFATGTFDNMNGGETRSASTTLRNGSITDGTVTGVFHVLGDLTPYATFEITTPGGTVTVQDGDSVAAFPLSGNASATTTTKVTIADDNAAQSKTFTASISWLLTAN